MNTKKTVIIVMVFVLAVFVCANFAGAQEYTPLVRIPGLPTEGTVNLSMYLVGIYNFLLSIVGIVAVMMLIIGGMRYITAAGNAAAIGDAKDIIQNAIVGLLLALLSWVFIATINPDVLYIKKPALTAHDVYNPRCTVSAADDDPCLCLDGTNTLRVALGYTTCEEACKGEDKCIPQKPVSCIASSSNNSGDANGNCECLDKTVIPLDTTLTPPDCQTSCLQIDAALTPPDNHCGWNYLVVRVNTDDRIEVEIREETIIPPFSELVETFYKLDLSQAQLWDFFLTDEGKWGAFKITSSSYNDGINIYECAILVTARRTTLGITGDYRNIFWVSPGTILNKDSLYLEKDLCVKFAQCCHRDLAFATDNACKISAIAIPGCDSGYDDPNDCAISTSIIGSNDIFFFKEAGKLFKTKYSDGIIDENVRCSDENPGAENERSCDFAESKNSYIPEGSLLCNPASGKWVPWK